MHHHHVVMNLSLLRRKKLGKIYRETTVYYPVFIDEIQKEEYYEMPEKYSGRIPDAYPVVCWMDDWLPLVRPIQFNNTRECCWKFKRRKQKL